MRILQIINALTLGGAQFVLLDLARQSRSNGCEVEIACFRDGPIGNTLRREGFVVHVLGETILDLPAFVKLIRILAKFKPGIVHSHLFRATFWARVCCWLSSDIKLVTSIHGSETESFHCLERLLNRFSNCFVFPSHFLCNWYTSKIRSRRSDECRVIYPGVNIAPIGASHQSAEVVKIGTLSRLHPVKGIDRLIKACSQLKQRHIRFELIIGGDGRHRQDLLQLVKTLNVEEHCRFSGEISDRQSFLDELDIFVAPSRQEAFGIHICEAMERALTVVAADVGGIPELIEHNRTGILFNPENESELSGALENLICNQALRQQLGQNARKKVEESFSRKIAIDKHIELFNQLTVRRQHAHFAVSSAELGGGERVALGIMKALIERGWQVSATCSGSPFADEIAKSGITVYKGSMRCGGLFFALKLLFSLSILRPDVISSHLNRASLIAGILGKICRIPSVSHIHGLNKKNYYCCSDFLVAVSHAVKKHMSDQSASMNNLRVIANRIESPALTHRKAPGSPLRIVITAKLHANKGHQWALEAIAQNLDQLGNIRIDILGSGPERSALEKLCKNSVMSDHVVFHGFVADPEIFYNDIDIALLPSLGEGIPLSLLEAMRWGIPCIASNIGGIPEIVEHGENGLLIEPGDGAALISAIRQVADSSNYERFSRAAIEHFKRINNYPQMIDEFEELLLQAIGAKP
ncbi:MAG: glycosyltransferase [Candidatus Riflebacteria bacterium]|nr:glycosyltransferase [Candidatus Riflebacteria bacterium]